MNSPIIPKDDPIFVTGVSFAEDSIEIIYLDEDEQTEQYGFLHTVFLKTESPEINESFDLIQAELRHLITLAHELKSGVSKSRTLRDAIAERESSRIYDEKPLAESALLEETLEDDGEEAGFEGFSIRDGRFTRES